MLSKIINIIINIIMNTQLIGLAYSKSKYDIQHGRIF